MPKPTSKKELLDASQLNYQKLFELIDSLSKEEQTKEFPKGTLNRNLRDIITHLHHWHLLFFDWYKVGMAGDKPSMPSEGFTWQTLPALNKEIWSKYQKVTLTKSKKLLDKSHADVQAIIKDHSDKELFEKKKYAWTGSTSLGVYLISNSVSHYNWAIKQIKKGMR